MPLFHQHIRCNKKIIIMKAAFLTPTIFTSFATASPQLGNDIEQLAEISVTANTSEISTNSKIIKNSEQLEKQQVNNIRDLTRYDAGISVVEQNRGGTSGFSIRGVDKNRVAITVDGIPQLQSHTTNLSVFYEPVGSGARNEVELENISSVEINKGSQSFQAGSGALGGSVNFKTKNINDILSEGEKFALTSKTAYSSKNSQFMQSLGTAFDVGGLKGLFQYTNRDGKETKIHDDVLKKKMQIRRTTAYVDRYKLSTNTPNEENSENVFFKCKTCTEPFYYSRMAKFHDLKSAMEYYKSSNGGREFTPQELEQLKQMVYQTETVSAKDYTGPDREAPDPLKSKTHSYLARLEYEITPNQLIGGIFEDTKQRYATRDMKYRSYYFAPPPPPSFPDPKPKYPSAPKGDNYTCLDCPGGWDEAGYKRDLQKFREEYKKYQEKLKEYQANTNSEEDKAWRTYEELAKEHELTIRDFVNQIPHPGSGGVYLDDIAIGPYAPLVYTRAHFSTEEHRKQRQSLYYIIEPKNKWADKLEFNLDLQKISIDSDYRKLGCSKYPIADKNCRASRDKPGSSEELDNVFYQEKRSHLGLKYDNSFKFDPITYRINLTAGATRYNAIQNHDSYVMRYGGLTTELRDNMSGGTRLQEYIPNALGRVDNRDLRTADRCSQDRRCSFKLKGSSKYFSLYNQISFGRYLDIGGGFLRDRDSVSGDKKFLLSREYNNTIYKFNVMLKPIEQINVAYNYSTGFRNPSSQEVYGWSPQGKRPTTHLKPETSAHHEVSISFKGDWGYLEANKFISSYKNLISYAVERDTAIAQDYNFSNASIEGYGIQGYFDLHSIMQIIPTGFSTNITYEKSKPKKATRVDDRLIFGTLYAFDAIQPARVVVGLNYDAPSEQWGTSLIMTYSKAKDPKELETSRFFAKDPKNPINNLKVTRVETKPWKTIDLLGYYKIRKNITLNVGVYNLLNTQYSTWESVRRSSTNSIHSENSYANIARYSAPGRNYFVSLNMKF